MFHDDFFPFHSSDGYHFYICGALWCEGARRETVENNKMRGRKGEPSAMVENKSH